MPYLINQSSEGLPSISASYDDGIKPEGVFSGFGFESKKRGNGTSNAPAPSFVNGHIYQIQIE